ncbi:MAG: FtsX-like permease family protein [Halieaceae bacterium]|jgi:putative ABC transport system permease protein|nr:FtsX-like permease family protein [Halieaceae bacterium]
MTALRMLLRDWRGGELGVLLAALVVAVAIVSGISAFTSRLQSSLEQESHRFLAADRVVSSSRPIPVAWEEEAGRQGLRTARLLLFPSMVFAGDDDMVLASIKAASDAYPLRGELVMSQQAFGSLERRASGPPAGEVWLDSRLFPLLGVAVGDRVTVGDASLTVGAALRSEPDQASGFLGYGPRLLMNVADIPATNVVQPGSRVEYRLLLAGDEALLRDFVAQLEPLFESGERLLDIDNSQRGIGSALDRAESFLLLAGSLGVVLAGVAIALAARRFSERHYDYVAIMKSLGAESGVINRLYGLSLLLLGVFATLVGGALGWALQAAFFALFGDALPVQPGPAGPRPYLVGAATAVVCLLAFAWPPLGRLGKASPLKVLRRDLPNPVQRTAVDNGIGLLAVLGLMLWYSGDLSLTLAVLAGLAASVTLAAAMAWLLLRGGRLAGMRAGSIWRLALASLQRNGGANTLQVVIFSLAIMLLLILVLVRTSLLEEWQMQLPEGTPNHFLLNIAPEEVNAVRESLARETILSEPLYPMIRGRVVAVNSEPLAGGDSVADTGSGESGAGQERPDDGPRERESNLTWSAVLPPGNVLVAGEWWSPDTREALVSVEEGMAERLEVSVGDRLRYLVGAQPLEVTVASIRRVDWESMQPNFFMVFPPAVLQDLPATFMTSFYLPPGDKRFLNEFVRGYPTVTVVEMDVVISQLRAIVSQVSAAIELVLAVILLAGALVLVAGVQSSVDTRLHEGAVLRALGASRGLILGGVVIEFAALGLFAGLLATVSAEVAVYVLQTRALDMEYSLHPEIWLLGPLAAVLLIGALGVWNCRRVVYSPPLLVLREL